MTIFGIGVDVVENARIRQSIDRVGEPFLDRIFTKSERTYCDGMKFSERHYAARFAAKEAISKAFGTGIGENLHWHDMEILRRESGEPFVVMSGRGKEFVRSKGIKQIMISMTHTDHYSAANAVVCCKEPSSSDA
ncbi:MAG: holo-[acyl-carrier protein] synthase [Verrucomicrobiales bacterium]|jgi:holo-[acyl-carrier protein] synthase